MISFTWAQTDFREILRAKRKHWHLRIEGADGRMSNDWLGRIVEFGIEVPTT